jgi:hypothetical protein
VIELEISHNLAGVIYAKREFKLGAYSRVFLPGKGKNEIYFFLDG